ncbi:MAG: class I SAM-dependent methyltransferase [Anaerolineae bacterium]|nr:class I SAM-dependent methyltransferase [Anaerolineae bacterium]
MSTSAPRQPGPDPAAARLFDEHSRELKAVKILTALSHVLGQRLDDLTCLDIGCSRGLITRHLAGRFRMTVGIEYDAEAVMHAAGFAAPGLGFVRGDGQRLPIADGSLDVVICAQVYEHVTDVRALLSEIWRVLKPAGVCFFSGPNRLYPWEFHVRLPFVHWLPAKWAEACVRWLRRGEGFDVRALTLWALHGHLADFEIHDLTVAMIRRPHAFGLSEEMPSLRWFSRLPEWLLRILLPLMPNFNWVLSKPLREAPGVSSVRSDLEDGAWRSVGR